MSNSDHSQDQMKQMEREHKSEHKSIPQIQESLAQYTKSLYSNDQPLFSLKVDSDYNSEARMNVDNRMSFDEKVKKVNYLLRTSKAHQKKIEDQKKSKLVRDKERLELKLDRPEKDPPKKKKIGKDILNLGIHIETNRYPKF